MGRKTSYFFFVFSLLVIDPIEESVSSCDLDNLDNNQAGENLCENDLMDILGVNTEGDVKDLLASSPENCLIEPLQVKLSDERCLKDSYQIQSIFTNETSHVLYRNLPRLDPVVSTYFL